MNKECIHRKTRIIHSHEAMGNITDSSERIKADYCEIDNYRGDHSCKNCPDQKIGIQYKNSNIDIKPVFNNETKRWGAKCTIWDKIGNSDHSQPYSDIKEFENIDDCIDYNKTQIVNFIGQR